MPPILSVRDLSIELGSAVLLDKISLDVGPGERVCLLGESGSGKSLIASSVIGLLPSNAVVRGSIRVAGHEVAGQPVATRPQSARVSMIFQDSHSALNPLVPVGKQLREALRRRQALGVDHARQAAVELLHSVHLPSPEAMMRRRPPELSGGQRQRVCIALALACRTPLLVADEPTTALDVVTQAQVLRVLKAGTEAEGSPALLFITHDLGAAAQLCTRAVIIHAGKVVETGNLPSLMRNPKHPFTAKLVDAARAGVLDTAHGCQAA